MMDRHHTPESNQYPEIEKKLSKLLLETCDMLYPTTGFSLHLEGIHPTPLVKKELEAFSGLELSDEKGASITLAYNIETNALELESFEHTIKHSVGDTFSIQRTMDPREELCYIPFANIGNSQYDISKASYGRTLNSDLLASFLAGYHLSHIPHPTHESYQLWRADLLSNCEEGWKTTESVTLITGFTEQLEEAIQVRNEVFYQDGGDTLSRQEITHSHLAKSVEDSSTLEGTYTILTEEADPFGRTIHAHERITLEEHDPFVINYTTVENISIKDLPLNEKTKKDFDAISSTAQALLQQ